MSNLGLHIDEFGVNWFADEMKSKMFLSWIGGREGWNDPELCSIEYLQQLLQQEFDKPNKDYIDIANYCMMIAYRTKTR